MIIGCGFNMRRKLKRKLSSLINFLYQIKLRHSDLSNAPEVNWISYNSSISSEKREIPKIIWIYWESSTESKLIDICIESIKQNCADYQINFLDSKSVEKYIGFLPQIKVELPLANISDYIRLTLLAKFGGIWLDASIFLNEDFDWILEKYNNQDAIVLYSDECTTDLANPITETWLIFAPVNSSFIKAWRTEFLKCLNSENPQYYYKNLWGDKDIVQNIKNYEYLICYISAIVVLRRDKYNLLYANSGALGHYYNYLTKWNGDSISYLLLNKDKAEMSNTKFIKITGPIRPYLEHRIDNKKYIKNSVFGEFL